MGSPKTLGTAVNVVAMVFGNLGDDSGTGVAFTRNPSTGERRFYGEFLVNAQGEDVVAGIRTPLPIDADGGAASRGLRGSCRSRRTGSSGISGDMQDLEFTVERGQAVPAADANGQTNRCGGRCGSRVTWWPRG